MTNNPQDGLSPAILPLDKGLDLTTPKLLAPAGSLLSCLNYEITDTAGLSRIDGFEAVDGWTSAATNTLYHIRVASVIAYSVGDILSSLTSDTIHGDQVIFGEVVEIKVDGPSSYLAVMMVNSDYLREDSMIYDYDTATAVYTARNAVLEILEGSEYYTDENQYFQDLTNYHDILRANVVSTPGIISAVHRFRGQDYVVGPTYLIKLRPWTSGARINSITNWSLNNAGGVTFGNTINGSTAFLVGGLSAANVYNGVYNELTIRVAVNGDWTGTVGGFLSGVTVAHPSGSPDLAEIVSVTAVDATGHSGYLYTSEAYDTVRRWKAVDLGQSATFNTGTYGTEFPPKIERDLGSTPSTSATYYLTNGTTIYSVTLVSIFKNSGTFVAGTAEGIMQFTNLTYVSGSSNAMPDAGWDMHTNIVPAPGNKIAEIVDYTFNKLPEYQFLETDKSKYQFINANFYSDENWDAMYGANGSGRAFYFDGTYFAFIVTQMDSSADRPRHIAIHALHLALGYKHGSLLMSAAGEPWNFQGVDGASEWGYGDNITGLIRLNGTLLGVFCQASVHALSGTSVDNFSTQVLIPRSGCIEYTLVDMGEPVYCNHAGIVTLSQTEKYGDYLGEPLSKPVNSWLRPRLVRTTAKKSAAKAALGAIAVRAKNQYRLIFKDGMLLTMTIGATGEPQFTWSQYERSGSVYTPYAWCSVVDEDGSENLRFSYFNPRTLQYTDFLYEWDRGWGFNGITMDHYFETNWNNAGNPTKFFGVRKVRLYGISQGRAQLLIAASGQQNDYDPEYNTTEEWADLPKTKFMYNEEGFPVSSMTNLLNRGLAIQLKVSTRNQSTDGLISPEPPHIVQALVLHISTGGKTDA